MRTKNKLQDNIRKVADLTNAGFNNVEIAEKLGLKPSTVNLYRSLSVGLGITIIRQRPNRPSKRKAMACSLYESGKSVDDIADEMGISKEAVRSHLKHAMPNKPKQQTQICEARWLFNLKCKDIAKKFDITPGTVFTVLHRIRQTVRDMLEANHSHQDIANFLKVNVSVVEAIVATLHKKRNRAPKA